MAAKILRSILTVAIAMLLISISVITGVLYQYFGDIQQSQLIDELGLAANGTQLLGKDYLEASPTDQYRLTWIASNGEVLYDSHADEMEMENHADREEIKEAFTSGTGHSIRQSKTLTEQTIYEATRLHDGSVLRISVSRATAAKLVMDMLPAIFFITLTAIALSPWLAYRMTKRVVDPLNSLDLENPMENEIYEELSPLLSRIENQQTKIRQQMETLRRHEEDFAQITNNMKEALVLLNHTDTVISFNPAAARLFGEALQAKSAFPYHTVANMEQAVLTARETGYYEFRETVDFRTYQFDISRIESSGTIHGLVVLAFDVTEQVDAERVRREFTANVSHELKTPLHSIIGSAELMENGMVKPEDLTRFIGYIRREASRLVTLVEDILRLSQLDEDVEFPRESVPLLTLAEEVAETLTKSAQSHQVTLKVEGDDVFFTGIRRLLFELIYNLTDNAIRYNRPGGTVDIGVFDEDRQIHLCIRDSGIGIPPEHLEKVFERFYRVDKSHSRNSGGNGLGLSIVKHAVQYHNGRIELHSDVDQGTTLDIYFEKE